MHSPIRDLRGTFIARQKKGGCLKGQDWYPDDSAAYSVMYVRYTNSLTRQGPSSTYLEVRKHAQS